MFKFNLPVLENRSSPVIARSAFLIRVLRFFLIAVILLAFSLSLGCVGYHLIAGLPWIDSLLNASMILTGMGPVDEMNSTGAKLFASFYAIYSGVAFLSTVGVIFAPIVHRFLHILHVDESDESEK